MLWTMALGTVVMMVSMTIRVYVVMSDANCRTRAGGTETAPVNARPRGWLLQLQ